MIELNFNKCADEITLCKGNYFHFRKYSKTIDQPSPEYVGGLMSFPQWDYLKQLAIIYLTKPLTLVVKERQLFISWETSNFCLWFAMFHFGANIPYFSKGGAEANELLNKSQTIYHNLPHWMQLETERDCDEELSFKKQNSHLRAFSGAKYGGTSFTNSIVVNDEWDFHEYDVENWNAIRPTISEKGRRFIGISTVDKLKAVSVFQDQAAQALHGESPFTLVFFGRGSRPDRNEKWYEKEEKTVTPSEMKGLTRELYMAQNHPRTIEEALAPASSIAVIKSNIIEYLKANRREPIRTVGAINIYQEYHVGHKYICASDPASGAGLDNHAVGILDITDYKIAADIYDNNIGDTEMFIMTEKLREIYQFPLWVIESGSDYGGRIINMAQKNNSKNLYWEDKEHQKCGLRTHDGNRVTMWAECASAINDGLLMTPSQHGINEMQSLVFNPQKRGRIDAKRGSHDDYFSMMSLAWWVKGSQSYGEAEVFNYLTGGK
jgi:hypothetical protein